MTQKKQAAINKHSTAEKLFGSSYESMDERTQKVARHITERKHISTNLSQTFDKNVTFGQRAADAVARFGGSWAFIMLFAVVLIFWVVLNSYILVNYSKAFDPYPYIQIPRRRRWDELDSDATHWKVAFEFVFDSYANAGMNNIHSIIKTAMQQQIQQIAE